MSDNSNTSQNVDTAATAASDDIRPQGNGDWIGLRMENSTGVQFKILSLKLQWGKVYRDPNDKDTEIKPPSALEGTDIDPKSSYTINACGRNSTASGTEGTVIIGYHGTQNISIYWDVPDTGKNTLTARVLNGPYWVNVTSAVPSKGPIGNITVEFGERAN
ncbi:hypothetical protein FGADI_13465 [Fusarium gaditjirri]|uniref:Uncharacterized protein n=1 Tax=Fusarium gaditjirri TaxID=282569 RepID=A0A8H4WMD3_9HYPO|nr:hypothetical protein FGADI_13465 [Fusarium gaditjirri]